MRKFNLILGLIPFLSACCSDPLSVRTEYVSHYTLASYHVGTPDPRLLNPPVGERLVVSWSVTPEQLGGEPLNLEVNIRLRNHVALSQTTPICKPNGAFTYTLINDDYFNSGGIVSYQAKLLQGDCLLNEWRHQVWAELIELDVDDCDYYYYEDDDIGEGIAEYDQAVN